MYHMLNHKHYYTKILMYNSGKKNNISHVKINAIVSMCLIYNIENKYVIEKY